MAKVDATSSVSSKLLLYSLILSFKALIEFLNCGLWFLNLKNLSFIISSSFAAASNLRPLLVAGTKGTSIVFSIEPVPDWTFVIPQPPSSDTAFNLSFFCASVSNG